MITVGLEHMLSTRVSSLQGKRAGILCHAASITSRFTHILDACADAGLTIGAVFGPQHGLFGQTQDNMIEWEGGFTHPKYNAPVYSLYGEHRVPQPYMLNDLDIFIIDLQDVGARPYTYVWTLKHCMAACTKAGIPLLVCDRPNPIAALDFDGPLLDDRLFSFVGGACIPLCHRMTVGEISLLLKKEYFPDCNLTVEWMSGWQRDSLFEECGFPWVMPSPNMPTPRTALVYPGMVLLEATTVSEGRGTTRPFELIGAKSIDFRTFTGILDTFDLPGCVVRRHDFMPTFHKYAGEVCTGMQVHVTNPREYRPVRVAVSILAALCATDPDIFSFKKPPYEYETEKMPFDILSGDEKTRKAIETETIIDEFSRWNIHQKDFLKKFNEISYYPEKL